MRSSNIEFAEIVNTNTQTNMSKKIGKSGSLEALSYVQENKQRLLEEKRRAGGTVDARIGENFDTQTGRNKLTCKLDKDDITKYVIAPVMKIDEGSSGGTGGN